MKWTADAVGPGWKNIVQPLIDRCEKEKIFITQIKEKFGELRFYTGPASEDFYKAVDEAGDLSSRTCENCGEEGQVISVNGWLRATCEKCLTQQ